MMFHKFFVKIGVCTLIIATFCLIACQSEKDANIPDVSDIQINLDITRFEQLLFADTAISAVAIEQLKETYPAFAEVYFNYVFPGAEDIVVEDEESQIKKMQAIIRHPRTQWLYDTVQHIFPDLSIIENDLTSAFQYAKYYFPEKETPKIYTTISDFGYFPFVYAEDSLRDGIGISLEMFLGDTFPYMTYTGLNNAFSDYLTRSYNKDHVVRRTIEVWVDDIAGPPSGNRLIDLMIHNGKKLFILESLMPHTPDTVIMDYSSIDLDWVKANEKQVWYFFTTNDMLYETSMRKLQKHLGPSPSSPGMPPEAPGNTASWLGWQIVSAYMHSHPATTLPELIGLKDSQMILDQSGYRPPR
jgi:hypothetical protein